MKFENGKFYQNTDGDKLAIVGSASTTMYGECLIGETLDGQIIPIGMDEASTKNFVEITKDEWMLGFLHFQEMLTALETMERQSVPVDIKEN